MAPIPYSLMSSGSKKRKPRYICLSEANASHSHKIWPEVSSSVPHFLQVGLLLIPIIYKCLRKVLCPVSGPITTLDCVLLKDNNRALVARLGPEINSLACLCILQGPRHNTRCCFSIQRFIFLLIFYLEAPKKGSGPTEPLLANSSISFPLTPAYPGTQYNPTACRNYALAIHRWVLNVALWEGGQVRMAFWCGNLKRQLGRSRSR